MAFLLQAGSEIVVKFVEGTNLSKQVYTNNFMGTTASSDTAYEPIKRLLAAYEGRTQIVVNTCDCYYLEFRTAEMPRFFAAVERRECGAVLRLQGLLRNPDIIHILSRQLLQYWDGQYSFVFPGALPDIWAELNKLLELSLEQGYNHIGNMPSRIPLRC